MNKNKCLKRTSSLYNVSFGRWNSSRRKTYDTYGNRADEEYVLALEKCE